MVSSLSVQTTVAASFGYCIGSLIDEPKIGVVAAVALTIVTPAAQYVGGKFDFTKHQICSLAAGTKTAIIALSFGNIFAKGGGAGLLMLSSLCLTYETWGVSFKPPHLRQLS